MRFNAFCENKIITKISDLQYFAGISIGHLGRKTKLPKYDSTKYSFELSYTICNKWTLTFRMLEYVSSKNNFRMVECISA